jgi:predicted nucleic acid-binding protein
MTLVDAGPLVAVVDADDQHHRRCVTALREIREPLSTVWPALTEAMYLLLDLPRGQHAIWEMIDRKAVRILPLDEGDVPRIRELMEKYADRPMDLADAALVRVAEREGIDAVFTVDRRDFQVYRLFGRKRFRLVPAAS